MKRMHLQILGRVQGVYFRASAKVQAETLALVGWVRNCDDGSVELVAEGPLDDLNTLLKWCEQGPQMAMVKSIDLIWEERTGVFSTFEIRRSFK